MDSSKIVKLGFDKPYHAWYSANQTMTTHSDSLENLHAKLSSTTAINSLIHLAVEEIILRYRADTAILLVAPNSNAATCWAGTPMMLPELLIPGLPAKIQANDLATRALQSGQIQIAQEPGLNMQDQTVLVLPIKSADAIVGALRLSSERINAADAQLLATLETITSYIAENITRLQSPVSSDSTLQTETETPDSSPTKASTPIAPSAAIHALCERVYRGVAGLMVCDRFMVTLDEQIVFQIENGVELPSAPISYEREMIAYIKRQHSGVLVTDQSRDVRFKILRDTNSQSIKSLVCAPLIWNENIVGIVSVQSYRAKNYSDVELKVLTLIADLMAMAWQNIQK
jgi:transcriptional regulator with GAF, ATPase, and Fis domain